MSGYFLPVIKINMCFTPYFFAEPGAPHNLKIEQPEKDKLCAYWDPPVTPNGVISKYTLYFQRQSEQPEIPMHVESRDVSKCLSDQRSISIFDVGVNYTFWVKNSLFDSFLQSLKIERACACS